MGSFEKVMMNLKIIKMTQSLTRLKVNQDQGKWQVGRQGTVGHKYNLARILEEE